MALFGKQNPVELRRRELAALQEQMQQQEALLQEQLHQLQNPEKPRVYQPLPDEFHARNKSVRKQRDLGIHRRQARKQVLLLTVPLVVFLIILWNLCKRIF